MQTANPPISGTYAPAFAPVAAQFARHFAEGAEIGASLCVYHRGERVVDLWGGLADRETGAPWHADSLIVLFSATKGLAAMALNLAAERGRFAWDRPVADYWPAFAAAGKAAITVRQLFNHRAGLPSLTTPLTLDQVADPAQRDAVRALLAAQPPAWPADADQGYHATTFGLYADAFFELACGEPLPTFLHRELLDPLGADVFLGTPPEQDARVATLYPVPRPTLITNMLVAAVRGGSHEAQVARGLLGGGPARTAFTNPSGGAAAYNLPPVRRTCLSWASATGTARGLALAYVPWSMGGVWRGRRYVQEATIAPLLDRQGWSERDRVLCKPQGWTQGFLKEEGGVFSDERASFGHPGLGGTLGWCDPKAQLAWAYTMNRSDWRVRSPRAVALCRALYACRRDDAGAVDAVGGPPTGPSGS